MITLAEYIINTILANFWSAHSQYMLSFTLQVIYDKLVLSGATGYLWWSGSVAYWLTRVKANGTHTPASAIASVTWPNSSQIKILYDLWRELDLDSQSGMTGRVYDECEYSLNDMISGAYI
jgi:hypothetical protein